MKSTYVYDPENQAAHGTFIGFLTFDNFKSIALGLIDLLKKHSAYKQLNDISVMKVLEDETTEWLQKEWFPKAAQAGLRYFAFVVPESIFGKMSMENANKKAESEMPIEIRYFKDLEEARAWLKSK